MKTMSPHVRYLFVFGLFLSVGLSVYLGWTQFAGASQETNEERTSDLVEQVVSLRQEQVLREGEVDFGEASQINILLLGLDERKEETEYMDAHCDAIHMFTLDIKEWTIDITSVPRGTSVYIPGGPYASNEYYLANACAFAGLDYGISQIEQIVGVKADYIATVGFSQTLGILRLLDLPTTESLQWLRHRQSYQIGEPQRTSNQATFMKDLIVQHITRFEGGISVPVQYVLYSFVDTDMSFSTARALIQGYIEAEIDQRPEAITTRLRPYYPTEEIHFDFENYQAQLETLLDFLRPRLSKEDLSDMPLEQVQAILIDFIESEVESGGDIENLFEKQLWLQVEDENKREELHFAIVQAFAFSLVEAGERERATEIATDYTLEKELLDKVEWAEKGELLLDDLIAQ